MKASRLSFPISASRCGLPLPALSVTVSRRRTSMLLHLGLRLKSLLRAFVSPIEQRGLRCSTGKQNRLRQR